jgi:shikimate kinase
MGAGKSTIGRQLARELKLDFIDTDREIEERSGAGIDWIFDVEGEAGFRRRETRIIAEVTQCRDIVMATGGGVVEDNNNRQLLSARGTVVYLYATVEQQLERTARDKNRPLLKQGDPQRVLQELFARRHSLYQEIADIEIAAGARNPRLLLADIILKINSLRSL